MTAGQQNQGGGRRARSRSPGGGKGNRSHSSSRKASGSNSNGNSGTSTSAVSDLFKSMVRGAATTAGATFTSKLGESGNGKDEAPSGVAGNFDMYLFAMVWAPRFCCTNNKQCTEQSKDGLDDLATHGLWPAYSGAREGGRTYPAFCNNSANFTSKNRLALHEWKKHGTCSGLSPEDYFKEEAKVEEMGTLSNLRDFLNESAGSPVSLESVVNEAGGARKIGVMASKFCQLQEVTTCWRKNPDGTVGPQQDCPDHLLSSSRNSAVLQGCSKVFLDSSEGDKCAFISKELLKTLKEK